MFRLMFGRIYVRRFYFDVFSVSTQRSTKKLIDAFRSY